MKLLKKSLVVFLVIASIFCVSPIFNNSVEAATKVKKVSTNYNEDKLKNQKNYKKIPAIKKGTTKVTMKKQYSYVKFTAPKKATYKIKFSGVKKTDARYVCGHINISKLKTNKTTGKKYFVTKNVRTNGGRSYAVRLANKSDTYGEKVYRYLKSRTVTIDMKKGETIYIDGYFAGGTTNKTTYTVKISQVK